MKCFFCTKEVGNYYSMRQTLFGPKRACRLCLKKIKASEARELKRAAKARGENHFALFKPKSAAKPRKKKPLPGQLTLGFAEQDYHPDVS